MDTERAVVPAIRSALADTCPSLRDGVAADVIGGLTPAFVASPASTSEASALLAAAFSVGLAVVPRGAGTGLSWGAPPAACDLVVDLGAMDRVIEHAAGDLVARVQAGATIGQLASVLAAAGQELALDAPAEATVGGVIAAGMAGPRRFRYGAPRDLLIGLTVVRADGVIAHSGGKVVKNVAGYDLGKLFAGSQGTLGLITEATFRLHPRPSAVAYVTAEFGSSARASAAAAVVAAAGSALVPSAVELDWPGGAQRALRVGVLLEGTEFGVAERAKQMIELLGGSDAEVPGTVEASGASEVAQRGAARGAQRSEIPVSPRSGVLKSRFHSEVTVSGAAPARWGQLPSPSIVIRVAFWAGKLAGVLDALAEAGARAEVRPAVSGPAGAGLLYACLDPGTQSDAAATFVRELRGRLTSGGGDPRGSVTVLAAAPAVMAACGAYGPSGASGAEVPGAALMRAVKDQFDPEHRMFPGRLSAI
jgi:glycolate oxidase FAD binding subunit